MCENTKIKGGTLMFTLGGTGGSPYNPLPSFDHFIPYHFTLHDSLMKNTCNFPRFPVDNAGLPTKNPSIKN